MEKLVYYYSDGEFTSKTPLDPNPGRWSAGGKEEIINVKYKLLEEIINGYPLKQKDILLNVNSELSMPGEDFHIIRREIYARIPAIDKILSEEKRRHLSFFYENPELDSFHYQIGLQSVDEKLNNINTIYSCSNIEEKEVNAEVFTKWIPE